MHCILAFVLRLPPAPACKAATSHAAPATKCGATECLRRTQEKCPSSPGSPRARRTRTKGATKTLSPSRGEPSQLELVKLHLECRGEIYAECERPGERASERGGRMNVRLSTNSLPSVRMRKKGGGTDGRTEKANFTCDWICWRGVPHPRPSFNASSFFPLGSLPPCCSFSQTIR